MKCHCERLVRRGAGRCLSSWCGSFSRLVAQEPFTLAEERPSSIFAPQKSVLRGTATRGFPLPITHLRSLAFLIVQRPPSNFHPSRRRRARWNPSFGISPLMDDGLPASRFRMWKNSCIMSNMNLHAGVCRRGGAPAGRRGQRRRTPAWPTILPSRSVR